MVMLVFTNQACICSAVVVIQNSKKTFPTVLLLFKTFSLIKLTDAHFLLICKFYLLWRFFLPFTSKILNYNFIKMKRNRIHFQDRGYFH